MPCHEVYSPSSQTPVRQPTAPPYLDRVIPAPPCPPHARGVGAGGGAMDGRGRPVWPGLYRVHSRPDAKEPGQRMAGRVPFAPDRCPGRHGVLGGGHGLHCQCDGGAYPGQSVYRDGIDGYCRF